MARENAETAAAELERTINSLGGEENAMVIVRKMLFMHRTLNQSFTSRIIIPFIREMAKFYTDGRYDVRNHEACRICRIMYDALKAEYGRQGDDDGIALPMI